MDSTSSVSKGVFVFKNGAAIQSRRKLSKNKNLSNIKFTSFLDNEFIRERRYRTYKRMWLNIAEDINNVQSKSFTHVIDNLISFIKCCRDITSDYSILPTAALLNGINQSDHYEQFKIISRKIIDKIPTTILLILEARECVTIKLAIERIVSGLMMDNSGDSDSEDEFQTLKRSQYTLEILKSWYTQKFHDTTTQQMPTIIIILPDLELFNLNVLEHLLFLLSCVKLPIALVLGISTTISSFFNDLSHKVTSKLNLKLFRLDSSTVSLEKILDQVLFTPKYPFQLSGNVFKLLTDIFLFYDLSLNGFIQGLKYCIMDHYKDENMFSLCTLLINSDEEIENLSHKDIERIRRFTSFRTYIESLTDSKRIIELLTNDKYFKKSLHHFITDIHKYFMYFHCFMRVLLILVQDLPKAPLGKQLRDLYSNCQQTTTEIINTQEFKDCWQLLSMLSKCELIRKLKKLLECINEFQNNNLSSIDLINSDDNDADEAAAAPHATINDIKIIIENYIEQLLTAESNIRNDESQHNELLKLNKRQEFKEKLLEMSKQQSQTMTEYNKIVVELLNYLKFNVIGKYVIPFKNGPPLLELFIYSNVNSVKQHIMGAPRGAIDTALNNPQSYLRCKCCTLNNSTQLLSTLPDISVAYKLHLESGRMINLFDWLKAFQTVLGEDNDDPDHIDPYIQAKFTRSVAELEFLGFIKYSTKKSDHATRLTW